MRATKSGIAARIGMICLGVYVSAAMATFAAPATAQEPDRSGLGTLIRERLRAGGPFFTAEERAVIERACGYGQGEWDGSSVNMHDEEIHCRNGRTARGPEVRRVIAAARPRIHARVEAVMASAEVRGAISRVTERATARAMRAAAHARAVAARHRGRNYWRED